MRNNNIEVSAPFFRLVVDEVNGDDEVEFEVSAEMTRGTKAYLSGRPEDCYAAEGGEIVGKLTILDANGKKVPESDFSDDEVNLMIEALYAAHEKVSDEEWDYDEQAERDREDRYDDRY
jgi:hypothetical protein